MKVYIDTDEKIVEIISGNLGKLIDSLEAIGEDYRDYEVINSSVELSDIEEALEPIEIVPSQPETEYTYVDGLGNEVIMGDC